MAYIKTARRIQLQDGTYLTSVDDSNLHYAHLYEYISDGLSPVTYPIIELTVGEDIYYFEKEDVVSGTLTEEYHPISIEIPVSVLEFKVFTQEADFSMFSEETQNLLVERFPVLLYEKIDDSQIFLGKFYLDSWENVSENTIQFTAQDILGVLGETPFDGMYWDAATTLEVIFAFLLDPLDVDYILHADLLADELSGWIPPGDYREAIQQVCFAGEAYVSTSGTDKLLINPVVFPETDSWEEDLPDPDKTSKQKTKLQKLVTGIEIISHDYTESADQVEIYQETLAVGNYKIIFDQPYSDIVVVGPGYTPDLMATEDEAFTLTTEDGAYYFEMGGEYDFGPNVLYLTVFSEGEVTVTGFPFVDSRRSTTWMEDDIVQSTNNYILQVTEATMVNSIIVDSVMDMMVEYFRLRYKQDMSVFYYFRVQPRDIYLTSSFYDLNLVGMIKKVVSNLTGGFLQKVEMLGNKRTSE